MHQQPLKIWVDKIEVLTGEFETFCKSEGIKTNIVIKIVSKEEITNARSFLISNQVLLPADGQPVRVILLCF